MRSSPRSAKLSAREVKWQGAKMGPTGRDTWSSSPSWWRPVQPDRRERMVIVAKST